MVLVFWLLSVSTALPTTLFTINHSIPWSPPFFESWQQPPFLRWHPLERLWISEPLCPFTMLKPGLTLHTIFLAVQDSSITDIVCRSVGLSQLETFERLLGDFWENFERLLRDFWETSEGLLRDFWGTFERLLRDFWETSERLLRDFWETFETLLRQRFRWLTDSQRVTW